MHKHPEVNLSAFIYRLFHRDLSSIIRTKRVGYFFNVTVSSIKIAKQKSIVQLAQEATNSDKWYCFINCRTINC